MRHCNYCRKEVGSAKYCPDCGNASSLLAQHVEEGKRVWLRWDKWQTWGLVGFLIFSLIVIAALTAERETPRERTDRIMQVSIPTPTSSTSTSSASGYFGCAHYSNVLRDVEAGILTPAEMRTKIQEVERELRHVPVASSIARRLLAALTSGDMQDFGEEALSLMEFCVEVLER